MRARKRDILDLKLAHKSSLICCPRHSPVTSGTNSGPVCCPSGGWMKQTHAEKKGYLHSHPGMSFNRTSKGDSPSSRLRTRNTSCVLCSHAWNSVTENCKRPVKTLDKWKTGKVWGGLLSILATLAGHLLPRSASWETHLAHIGSTSRTSPSHDLVKTWSLSHWLLPHKLIQFPLLHSY